MGQTSTSILSAEVLRTTMNMTFETPNLSQYSEKSAGALKSG